MARKSRAWPRCKIIVDTATDRHERRESRDTEATLSRFVRAPLVGVERYVVPPPCRKGTESAVLLLRSEDAYARSSQKSFVVRTSFGIPCTDPGARVDGPWLAGYAWACPCPCACECRWPCGAAKEEACPLVWACGAARPLPASACGCECEYECPGGGGSGNEGACGSRGRGDGRAWTGVGVVVDGAGVDVDCV